MKQFGWLGVVVVALAGSATRLEAQRLWQADVLVSSLQVTVLNGNLMARIVVAGGAEEAVSTRVEIIMPIGVGIVRVGEGCSASAAPPGMSDLRGRVTCVLGNLPARGSKEVYVMTTIPPNGVAKTFGAFAMSDTPDPKPGNNFAERTLP